MLKSSFHFFAFALNSFTLWYDQSYVDLPNQRTDLPLKGRVLFLTIWCLILQTLYFAIALLNDLFGTNDPWPKKTPLITQLRDTLFSSIAFPLAIFVTFTFWSIYAIDRELVFPRALDAVFPVWMNHVMHTTIAVFIVLELYTTYRKYPTRNLCLSIIIIFNVVYLIWINIVYFESSKWVYPILEVLNWPLRILFFATSISVSCAIYVIGEKLNGMLWTKQTTAQAPSKKKSKKVR